MSGDGDTKCGKCEQGETSKNDWVQCDNRRCDQWFHRTCAGVSKAVFKKLNTITWFCASCEKNNARYQNLKWGEMKNYNEIRYWLDSIYEKLVGWTKNIMEVPSGQSGKDFISKLTALLQLFNNKTKWEPLAIHMVIVFVPLMLQNPMQGLSLQKMQPT